MALRKQRGRAQAYDNAVVGSQTTSFECTKVANVPPVELAATSTGFRDNPAVGSAPPTANPHDDIQVAVVTLAIENTKVGG
jgi:hypothetical protein